MGNFDTIIQNYLTHLNSIIESYNAAFDGRENISEQDAIRIVTRSRNLIYKITEQDSPYINEVEHVCSENWVTSYKAEIIIGILLGLKDELTIGGLNLVSELIRGELFEDFLEMAEYLNNEGYKDAAAVIAGSSIEAHLRRLAIKFDIPSIIPGENPRHKKAENINQELFKANVYSTFDMKQITAWLDLRNNAAHGNYSKYSSRQVMQLIEWTKDFITKNSA